MDINKILLQIIEEKFKELEQFKKQNGKFEKISYFEGNAVGQIGEKFVKSVFEKCEISMQNTSENTHDEFDIILEDGTKIEIKTARKGLKNNTFQFNGINPNYNAKFIICIGLSVEKAYFKIVRGDKIYDHKTRSFYLKIDDKEKKLVAMNPSNQANYKLTLNLKDLEPIENFENELRKLFLSDL